MGSESFRLEQTIEELMPGVEFVDESNFSKHNNFFKYGAGPTNVSGKVHGAGSSSIVSHLYGPFIHLMNLNQQAAKVLVGRDPGDSSYAMIMAGTGSTAADAAIANLLDRGESAVVISQGEFGNRLAKSLQRLKVFNEYGDINENPNVLSAEWGTSLNPQVLDDRLQQIKDGGGNVDALLAVLVETSTGVRDPNIAEYGKIFHSKFPDGNFIVDVVSGAGGIPISMHYMGANVVFTGVQKGLGSIQGIAIAVFDEQALKRIRKTGGGSVPRALSVLEHERYLKIDPDLSRPFVYTFPTQLGMALYQANRELFANGLDESFRRTSRASEIFARAVEGMGFRYFVNDPRLRAPTIHALIVPEGVKIGDYLAALQKYNTEQNGGLGQLQGKIIRVGLLGPVNTQEIRVRRMLDIMYQALVDVGYKPPIHPSTV